MLLMHMKFALDSTIDTASTDGKKIYFNPEFLNELTDKELDFVMMHEVLHVALRHCTRGNLLKDDQFNIACDIVVNSNILKSKDMKKSSITLKKYGESMHLAPDGKEGYEYTAEQVYEQLFKKAKKSKKNQFGGGMSAPNGNGSAQNGDGKSQNGSGKGNGDFDDHSRWKRNGDDDMGELLSDLWVKRLSDAAEVVKILDADQSRGMTPLCAQRLLDQLKKPQTDWRTILNNFVKEEICDYSFSPPDRRYDGDFFLPDFNEKDEKVKNILFMMDTSGSISDDMMTVAFSEIKGAIDQFNGALEGKLGFFDAAIYEPVDFASVDDLLKIRPVGGGGTDFGIIFKYVEEKMQDEPPASIVILTDGYAPFPPEELANGIPVLWIINNDSVNPPWGKVARIKV
jgi:predicted metal-dependent peptidase